MRNGDEIDWSATGLTSADAQYAGAEDSTAGQSAGLRADCARVSKVETITPLPAGIKAVYLDILARVQRESLTA